MAQYRESGWISMTYVWGILAVVLLLALLSGGKKNPGRQSGRGDEPIRIDRPHVIDPDDYECSRCHRRFRKNVMACPYCGARFMKSIKDETEFTDEEEELEAWDDED